MRLSGQIARQPQGGATSWLMLVMGLFLILASVFQFVSFPTEQILRLLGLAQSVCGLGLVVGATAELLPRHRRSLTAVLRTIAIAVLILGGIAVATLLVTYIS